MYEADVQAFVKLNPNAIVLQNGIQNLISCQLAEVVILLGYCKRPNQT